MKNRKEEVYLLVGDLRTGKLTKLLDEFMIYKLKTSGEFDDLIQTCSNCLDTNILFHYKRKKE